MPIDALRGAGLSFEKARYILELANRVNDRRLDFSVLVHHSDEDVIVALTELPGIGHWTAEMFLIFGFRRPDVLSLADAGLQRAVRLLYSDDAELKNLGQVWRPYCSVASWYLWRHLDRSPQRTFRLVGKSTLPQKVPALNPDPLDIIERDVVRRAVVELRRARTLMGRNGLRSLP